MISSSNGGRAATAPPPHGDVLPARRFADLEPVLRAIVEDSGSVRPPSAPAASPEVTVAMPARNAARHIGTALRSVLAQEDVALEIVVVDDGSDDETAAVAAAIGDRRVRVLRNESRRGIGACHNRALAVSRAPFVVHVDADDFVVPWAVRTMVDTLVRSPRAAQGYAYHLLVGENGVLSEEEFEAQSAARERARRSIGDTRRALLVHGMITNPLRTYRREALVETGPFNETLPWAVDYEMSVRLAEAHDMVLVPEFLYIQRVHASNTQQTMRFRRMRSWRLRASICRALLRRNGGRLLGRSRVEVYGLVGLGLLHILRGSLTGASARD